MDKQPKILIVDDTQINIDILNSMLKEEDYELFTTIDPYECLKIVQEQKIDLILLDVIMPIIDGYEICKLLKKNPNTKDIPVIFTTVKNEQIEKGFEVGAVDYITRPIKVTELRARVKTHLELRGYQVNLEEKIKKEIEKNNKKSELLFHQNKMLSMVEMMNNIAHQWRQPLAKINSVVFRLDKEINKPDINIKQIDNNLSDIEGYTQYMSDTIEEFINFVKHENNRKTYNLSQSIHTALKIIDNVITKYNISISLDLDDTINLNGFKNEFQQLFMIFINNSKETFLENNIEQREVQINLKKINDSIIIDIIDNISPNHFINSISQEIISNQNLKIAQLLIEEKLNGTLSYKKTNKGNNYHIKLINNN